MRQRGEDEIIVHACPNLSAAGQGGAIPGGVGEYEAYREPLGGFRYKPCMTSVDILREGLFRRDE